MAREQRKLAAFLAADVVGYSPLMRWRRADERAWNRYSHATAGAGQAYRRQRLGWLR